MSTLVTATKPAATSDGPRALPPHPAGWYCLMPSSSLKRGVVAQTNFVGHEAVVFRADSGRVAALHAHCPHMGAHMGHGGTVEGDSLRCPFHGFRFDLTGECVATPYGTLPSPKCIVPSWPVHETNGFIFAYHHPHGTPPDWTIPNLDGTGHTRLATRSWILNSHPQEVSENSVDIGHFAEVHAYKGFETMEPMEADGPHLRAKYAFLRPATLFRGSGGSMRVEIDVDVFGLGYSVVHVRLPRYGVTTRHFVLPTPQGDGRIELRIGLTASAGERASAVHPLVALLPRPIAARLFARAAFHGYTKDISDDFRVWNHKKYVETPLLARGDGPIMKYRRWAQQFY
jgi:nitrite reductase/ring-hydroxylating ferredoxin subunit